MSSGFKVRVMQQFDKLHAFVFLWSMALFNYALCPVCCLNSGLPYRTRGGQLRSGSHGPIALQTIFFRQLIVAQLVKKFLAGS
jgi:hypothetical protein